MSALVERVARALDPNCFMPAALQIPGYEYRRQVALDGARAAIEAMREPTQAMNIAAFDVCEIAPGSSGFQTGTDARKAIYRAMIDAALSPSPSHGGEVTG